MKTIPIDKVKTIYRDFIFNPLLAGLVIGMASICFLKSGLYVGMVLFAFGLSTVVLSKWKLFTGMAGFTNNNLLLLGILLVNVFGASIASLFAWGSYPDIVSAADNIVRTRIHYGFFGCLLNAIACGFIMTVSVKFARKNQWLPLMLGVPMFIICGFPHCIADVAYYCISRYDFSQTAMLWLGSVMGNYVGCKIPTSIDKKEEQTGSLV